jgi:arsenate reductase (glutaredoxin)
MHDPDHAAPPTSTATITLWHNPRCSKSRGALALLQERGVAVHERRYLDDPPTAIELTVLLDALHLEPWQLARMAEPEAIDLGLATWSQQPTDRARWIDAMAASPRLIERPIAVSPSGRAVVGRPPERVLTLLD